MSEVIDEPKTIPTDKLVKAYVKIRDARKDLSDEYEKQDNELKESLEIIEAQLLEACKTMGADSIRTPYGTISRTVKKRYWTNDWHSFYAFLKEHEALELLEKRVAQTNMSTFLEENPDLHPPGLNVDSRYSVVVRRK
jgi:sugar phosphate isomerase/epimerase